MEGVWNGGDPGGEGEWGRGFKGRAGLGISLCPPICLPTCSRLPASLHACMDACMCPHDSRQASGVAEVSHPIMPLPRLYLEKLSPEVFHFREASTSFTQQSGAALEGEVGQQFADDCGCSSEWRTAFSSPTDVDTVLVV